MGARQPSITFPVPDFKPAQSEIPSCDKDISNSKNNIIGPRGKMGKKVSDDIPDADDVKNDDEGGKTLIAGNSLIG